MQAEVTVQLRRAGGHDLRLTGLIECEVLPRIGERLVLSGTKHQILEVAWPVELGSPRSRTRVARPTLQCVVVQLPSPDYVETLLGHGWQELP